MFRRLNLSAVRALTIGALACLLLAGCSSGGGSNDSVQGALSEPPPGFRLQPGTGGPGTTTALPDVFIDQALEFTFDGPIDASSFGGFAQDPGTGMAREYVGTPPVFGAAGIPYNPFSNQAAAWASFQIRENQLLGNLLSSYIVGRHRDRPSVLVIDAKVTPTRAAELGIPSSVGFTASTVFTYRIPPGGGLMVGGSPALPVGLSPLALPAPVGSFIPETRISLVFQVGVATGPNPNPPRLLSIAPASGAAGSTADPMTSTDDIIMTFDQGIFSPSAELLSNVFIRNLDLGNRDVPGRLVIDPNFPTVAIFTPDPSWGPGVGTVTPERGFDIQISVGANFAPTGVTVPPITGLPQGTSALRLPMVESASNQVTFRTTYDPAQVASLAVGETFSPDNTGTLNRDASYTVEFDEASWNSAANPGVLRGSDISGSALAPFQGNPANLGTRSQVALLAPNQITAPSATFPVALISPFDDNVPGGANFPGITDNGSCHIMHLIEASDIGSPNDALELIEWGPSTIAGGLQQPGQVSAATYPNFQGWLGLTNLTAPFPCAASPGNSLTTQFRVNYNITNLQPVDPLNTSTDPAAQPNSGGVLVFGPAAYTTVQSVTLYYPFPTFTVPFDYPGGRSNPPNLVFEMNTGPGATVANFNRYNSAGFTPIRRVVGMGGATVGTAASGCDTYDYRLTFVSIVSGARSVFYDTGFNDPDYRGVNMSPDPTAQPAGSSAFWEFQGADVVTSNGTAPAGPSSAWLTYFNGGPGTAANTTIFDDNPTPSQTLDGWKFFRWRVELRNDPAMNGVQEYTSLIMSVSTPAVP